MEEFDNIVAQAAAAITEQYFRLPVHGAGDIYRERVCCYEFYHQMRARWPEACPYFLNGEVDKQSHPYFEDGGYPEPDFLVHISGTGNNYATMEVKPPGASAKDIRKDIGTLLYFRQWYERGLYLIYGVNPDAALERIIACAEDEKWLGAIELWVHPEIGAPAHCVTKPAEERGQ